MPAVTIPVGQHYTLEGEVQWTSPPPIDRSLTWTSSDPTKVKFHSLTIFGQLVDGPLVASSRVVIQGVAAGTSTITATHGAFSSTVDVTVSANPDVNVTAVVIRFN